MRSTRVVRAGRCGIVAACLSLSALPAGADEAWRRGADLHAASAWNDGDHRHAALLRPGRDVWSYVLVRSAGDLDRPTAWKPLPQTGSGLYETRVAGEGPQQHFVRHHFRADADELLVYWNREEGLPATDLAHAGLAAVFTAPEAGRYRVTGELRYRVWASGPPRDAAVTLAVRSGGAVRTLGSWAIPDVPAPGEDVLATLGDEGVAAGFDLRAGDQIVLLLMSSKANYRGMALDDRGLRIERTDPGADDVYAADASAVDAQRCLSLVDLDRAALASVKQQFEAGAMSEAMATYQSALFDRLGGLSLEAEPKTWSWAPTTAEDAMQGRLTYAHYGEPSKRTQSFIGLPGEVRWDHVPENGYATFTRDIATMHWAVRLVERAVREGDPAAAALWAGYWGDLGRHWLPAQRAMEQDPKMLAAVERQSIKWPTHALLYFGWRIGNFFDQLAVLGEASPQAAAEAIDPADLAAALTHMATYEVPAGITRLDQPGGVPNQRQELTIAVFLASVVLDDFRDAAAWRAKATQHLQAYLANDCMPDGTSLEQSFNYNKNLPQEVGRIIVALRNLPASPEHDAMLHQMEHASATRWAMLNSLVQPDGSIPSVGKINPYRATMPWPPGDALPTLPVSAAIHEAVVGDGRGPGFTSVYFPFGGYAALRTGWFDRDAFTMFKNSRPGLGHRREGGNGLSLWAFSRPLVFNSGAEQYTQYGNFAEYFNSTISQNSIAVDGYSQQLGNARQEDLPYAEPIAARYLHSGTVDFIEGRYDGDYAGWNFLEHGHATPVEAFRDADGPRIDDVSHDRQVVFLRELPAWIITDRVRSERDHLFTQSWCFPPSRDPGSVTIESAEPRIIGGQSGGEPRIDLLQFASFLLVHERYHGIFEPSRIVGWSSKAREGEPRYEPKVDVHTSWRGRGPQTVVTLVAPAETADSAVRSAEAFASAGVVGFDATMADGTRIRYRTTDDGAPKALGLPGIAFDAAAAMLVEPPTGDAWGIYLRRDASPADARFTMSGGGVVVSDAIAVPSGFRWVERDGGWTPAYE